MERKTMLIVGIVMVLGAVMAAVAVAQNTASENANPGDHQCTPEMMENMTIGNASGMAKNCAPEMMSSGDCENMADTATAGCGQMTADVTGNHMAGSNHCSSMDSGTASMMGTKAMA